LAKKIEAINLKNKTDAAKSGRGAILMFLAFEVFKAKIKDMD